MQVEMNDYDAMERGEVERRVDDKAQRKNSISKVSKVSEHIKESYKWIRVVSSVLISILILYILVHGILFPNTTANSSDKIESLLKLLQSANTGGLHPIEGVV